MGEKKSFICVKYVFFGFNVIIWLLGCAVLSAGLWLEMTRGPQSAVTFLSASTLAITLGAIVLFIGFLGCCGAFYENQCMLVGYFIVGMVVFTLQIAAGVLVFLHRDDLRAMIEKDLVSSMRWDYKAASESQKPSDPAAVGGSDTDSHQDPQHWWLVIDSLQAEMQCCGAHNYSDWYQVSAWPTEKRVPDSCCKTPEPGCGKLEPHFWFEYGCLSEINYWFVRNMYILGVVGITVAVFQILGMIAALVLFSYIRNNKFFM